MRAPQFWAFLGQTLKQQKDLGSHVVRISLKLPLYDLCKLYRPSHEACSCNVGRRSYNTS